MAPGSRCTDGLLCCAATRAATVSGAGAGSAAERQPAATRTAALAMPAGIARLRLATCIDARRRQNGTTRKDKQLTAKGSRSQTP